MRKVVKIKMLDDFEQNCIMVNPKIVKQLGLECGLLLSNFINVAIKTDCNSIVSDAKSITHNFGISKSKQQKCLSTLSEISVIKVEYENNNTKYKIQLDETTIADILNNGKPSKIKSKKNKFDNFYEIAVNKFSDEDILGLIYNYLSDKIGSLSVNQWNICLSHLDAIALSYPISIRKFALMTVIEKSIAGGWFDFYRVSEFELSHLYNVSGLNGFGEPLNVSASDTYELATDTNGNLISF